MICRLVDKAAMFLYLCQPVHVRETCIKEDLLRSIGNICVQNIGYIDKLGAVCITTVCVTKRSGEGRNKHRSEDGKSNCDGETHSDQRKVGSDGPGWE